MIDALKPSGGASSGPAVRIAVQPGSVGRPRRGWEEAIAATARWAVNSGAVGTADWTSSENVPAMVEADDERWVLEIAQDMYAAPTMLTELVRALQEKAAAAAEPRVIPHSSEQGHCRLVRPGGGPAVRADSALAFRDMRFDVEGRAIAAPEGPVWQRSPDSPFLTVVVRTQGRRAANLEEALTCLAAQTIDDFEVQLAVHDPSPAVLARVVDEVGRFAGSFVDRVNVFAVEGGGRARPLNAAIDRATGDYVAFLDDDDLVTADWVEAFAEAALAAPGKVARGVALNQPIARTTDGYEVVGPLARLFPVSFDLVEHLHENATPIFSYAVPRRFLNESGTRFCEDLPVLEDWDFLLRVALGCGVHDTGRATGIYHRWVSGESALQTVPEEAWQDARRHVLERLDGSGITLPPGTASRLAALVGDLRQARDEIGSFQQTVAACRREVDAMRRSRSWRMTAPVRWLSGRLRR
jgi:glycosyltransferase involved in cell wall biosynthesis